MGVETNVMWAMNEKKQRVTPHRGTNQMFHLLPPSGSATTDRVLEVDSVEAAIAHVLRGGWALRMSDDAEQQVNRFTAASIQLKLSAAELIRILDRSVETLQSFEARNRRPH